VVNAIPLLLYALLLRKLNGPQGQPGWIWRRENLLPLLGFKPWIIQPIASCNTNYAIPANSFIEVQSKNLPEWIEGIAAIKKQLGKLVSISR
jgi:hypothetical protein